MTRLPPKRAPVSEADLAAIEEGLAALQAIVQGARAIAETPGDLPEPWKRLRDGMREAIAAYDAAAGNGATA